MACITVGIIVALIAVLAAFNATSSGGFTVTYTAANNVKATVTAEYYVGVHTNAEDATLFPFETMKTADGEDSIVFTGEESEVSVTKQHVAKDININYVNGTYSNNSALYLRYTITNNSDTDVLLAIPSETFSSLLSGTQVIVGAKGAIEDVGDFWVGGNISQKTIQPQATYEIYIKIQFNDITILSETSNCTFNWLLDAVEE